MSNILLTASPPKPPSLWPSLDLPDYAERRSCNVTCSEARTLWKFSGELPATPGFHKIVWTCEQVEVQRPTAPLAPDVGAGLELSGGGGTT